jgi:hypothetical protein
MLFPVTVDHGFAKFDWPCPGHPEQSEETAELLGDARSLEVDGGLDRALSYAPKVLG